MLAQKVVTRSARAAVSKISADALLAKALSVRRSQAGSLLKTIRKVNAKKLQESDILVGHRFHTAGAEPYFFDNSYTHKKQHGAIPVDLTGRCVVAEEIKDRDKVTMRPLKWKCTNECRKLTSEEVAIVLKTNSLFQKSIEDLRAGLDALDSGCGHYHYDVTLKSHSGFIEQLGHPIYCELPECSSPLRIIRAAMPHFPALRTFTRLLYKARKCHMTILAIDSALASGNIEELIPFMGMRDNLSDFFSEDGVEHAVVSEDHSSSGLGCIERDLKVTHADLIAELHHPEKKRPLYATATRPIPKRRRPLYATATTQILNRSNLLKGSDIKRTSRRTALLKGRNTRTIQMPLRHLKGIGIGMTPLSDWLNVLPRGNGFAWVTELPLPPKGMSWHVVLH